MTTLGEIVKAVGQEIAGRDRIGDVTSGTATTAVLDGLSGVTDDENFAVGDLLQFPEAGVERTVTHWHPEDGEAQWNGSRSDDYTDETYILQPRPAYTLAEMRRSANECLTQLQRTYRMVLPGVPDTYEYPLDALPWLTSDGRIDAVVWSESPNQLHNEDYALWTGGSPDGWALAGGTAQKAAGGTWGPYSVRLTRSGADCTLSQSLPSMLIQWLVRRVTATPTTVYRGEWVKCSEAGRARIGIGDGTNVTYSDYHSGSGRWEWLTAPLPISASVSEVVAVNAVDTGDATADFSGAALVIGGTRVPEVLQDRGSKAFASYPIPHLTRNVGGVPIVELKWKAPGHGQLVVTSRRTFAELSAMTDETDVDINTAVSGTVMRLLQVRKSGQDRTRLDVVLNQHARKYARLAANYLDIPVQAPMRSYQVLGA